MRWVWFVVCLIGEKREGCGRVDGLVIVDQRGTKGGWEIFGGRYGERTMLV